MTKERAPKQREQAAHILRDIRDSRLSPRRFLRKQEIRRMYGQDDQETLHQLEWLESLNRSRITILEGTPNSTMEDYKLVRGLAIEKGLVKKVKKRLPRKELNERMCPSCHGKGELDPIYWYPYECIACGGSGVTSKTDKEIKAQWTEHWMWLPRRRMADARYTVQQIDEDCSHIESINEWGTVKWRKR